MKENTVIVGGNVGGNISSCEFKVTTMTMERKNLFITTQESLAVNNCTGETIKSSYWAVDDGFVFFTIIGTLILGIFVIGIVSALHD